MMVPMSLRPRIRFRWYLLAAFVGLFAAAATYAWLDGPRWRDTSAGPGSSPHFSRDRLTLTTFHGMETKLGEPFTPRIVKWEVASGRKLSELPLNSEGLQGTTTSILPLPDNPRGLGSESFRNSLRRMSYVRDVTEGRKWPDPIAEAQPVIRQPADSAVVDRPRIDESSVDEIVVGIDVRCSVVSNRHPWSK
jgi:hypothetical protein